MCVRADVVEVCDEAVVPDTIGGAVDDTLLDPFVVVLKRIA